MKTISIGPLKMIGIITLLLILLILLYLTRASDYRVVEIKDCQSGTRLSVYCEFSNPEDIVILPGERHLLISEFGAIVPLHSKHKPGSLSLFDTALERKKSLTISPGKNIWGEDSCHRDDLLFSPHGIDLKKRFDDRYQLAVINHMPRETIEMFEVLMDGDSWRLQWMGCLNTPRLGYFNDVALTREGSLFASHMYDRGTPFWRLALVSLIKTPTGFVYQWKKHTGFLKLQNSEGSFPNGVSISDDENSLFVNYVFNRRTAKLDIESSSVIGEHFSSGTPDNSFVDAEFLWVAAQDNSAADLMVFCGDPASQCSAPFTIYKLRQDDLSEVESFFFENTQMGLATVGVPLKNKLWLGTFRGDRIASFELDHKSIPDPLNLQLLTN